MFSRRNRRFPERNRQAPERLSYFDGGKQSNNSLRKEVKKEVKSSVTKFLMEYDYVLLKPGYEDRLDFDKIIDFLDDFEIDLVHVKNYRQDLVTSLRFNPMKYDPEFNSGILLTSDEKISFSNVVSTCNYIEKMRHCGFFGLENAYDIRIKTIDIKGGITILIMDFDTESG